MWTWLLSAMMLPAAAEPVRILALGDSYTIGEGVEPEQRWPMQLAAHLQDSTGASVSAQIIARTGWTTDELMAALDGETLSPPYDLVTVLIGVNNQYRGREVAEYEGEFRALLERAISYAGARPQRVLVVSIPDWGVTAFGQGSGRDLPRTARELDAYNAAAQRLAAQHGVAGFVDVTGLSRRAGADPAYLVADGLHPSARAYREWTEAIWPVASEALRQP